MENQEISNQVQDNFQDTPTQPVMDKPRVEVKVYMQRRLLLKVSLILVLLLFSITAIVLVYVQKRTDNANTIRSANLPLPTIKPSTTPSVTTSVQANYILERPNIYRISDEREKKLYFTNVPPEVKKIKVGPDGNTLHFQINPNDKNYFICASLTEKYEPAPSFVKNPPPNNPPWDFTKVGHAYTIKGCEYDNVGGFIPNSDYFVYMTSTNGQQQIEIENIITKERIELKIENKGQVSNSRNLYSYPGIGLSVIKSGKYLLIDLGNLFVINLTDKIILGKYDYEKQFGTYGHSIISNENLPIVILGFQFEGEPSLSAILDLSGTELTAINLRDYGDTFYNDIVSVERYEWGENYVRINFTNVDYLVDTLPESKDYYLSFKDKSIIQVKESEVVNYLMNTGKYQKVVCILDSQYSGYQGETFGCYGLKKVDTYEYRPGGNFTKVN